MTYPASDCAVVVSSCDAFSDAWHPFFTLFFRYWPNCPFPVYLISNELTYSDKRVRPLLVGADRGWASNTKKALSMIAQPTILWMLEDLLLEEPTDTGRIIKLVERMRDGNIATIHLYPSPPPDEEFQNTLELGRMSRISAYRVSLIASLWRKDAFIELIREGENAWQMELDGTERSRSMRDDFLSVKTPALHFFERTSIIRGKWGHEAIALTRREDIRIDTKRRPINHERLWRARYERIRKTAPFHFLRAMKRILGVWVYLWQDFWSVLADTVRSGRRVIRRLGQYHDFVRDLNLFMRSDEPRPANIQFRMRYEKNQYQAVDVHYMYQDRWAFEHIVHRKPNVHVDVGSRLDFVIFLSTIVPVKYVDIRPLEFPVENLSSVRGDITDLPFADGSLESLSCLHVAEHIGLGRYGDTIQPEGTRIACQELARVLRPNGVLYFSLPIGRPQLWFNVHRIHTPQQILSYFGDLTLEEFSVVDDENRFHRSVAYSQNDRLSYGCGMFVFRKRSEPAQ